MKALITVFEQRDEALDALRGSDYRKLIQELDDWLLGEIRGGPQSAVYKQALQDVRTYLNERAPSDVWSDS